MTENISIECGECWPIHIEFTEAAMLRHIKAKHPNYSEAEAASYAVAWAEDARKAQEEVEAHHVYLHKHHQCACESHYE